MTANKKTFFHLSTVQKRENPGISFSWIVILVKNLRNLARRLTNLPLFMTFVRDLKEPHPNALMESGGAPKIKGKGRTKKVKPVNTKVTVNGKGSLVIPKALVDDMKIKEGQIFEVKKVASGIQLKKVDES